MKRLLEKAAQTPEPPAPQPDDPDDGRGIIGRSLKKIATMLAGAPR